MRTFRLALGILCLAAFVAAGVAGALAAEASIEGRTTTAEGAAAFTAGLFLGTGFLLAGVLVLVGRARNGWAFAAAFPPAVANLFVSGGGAAASGAAVWTWISWALAAALFGTGLYALLKKRRETRFGLPPGTGRTRRPTRR